ncbi:MAG: hypothetical protein A3J76_00885 [Candidatus Moranbacteria bacterium RBG_13_45_13]|nr:MAG: hypothetical protein A3J76_00885 [Candidatus Moranbacteria bacterium RBG_13_45_13]
MILTTHILSGALVGAEIKNPFYVAIVSVMLHFLIDLFPHGDYLNKKSRLWEFWKVAVDLAVGLGIVFAIIFFRNSTGNTTLLANIGIGIFFSLLPDGTTLLYMIGMKYFKPIYNFHQKLHLAPDFSPEREFRLKNNLWDILISLISLYFLLSRL